jgi:2-methylcitrate dehydratase PrpD
MAADLARAGFTGASRILEGTRGFFHAMSRDHDPTRVTEGLGTTWKIGENGYKLHACCGHTHSAIDLAIAMRSRRRWSAEQAVEQIASIDVETYGPGFEIVKESTPRTPYQGKFSMAYCVAAGVLEGEVGLEQFSADRFGPEGVREPAIASLLARTRVMVADDLTAKYPAAWPARVAVTLTDGARLCDASDYPRGNRENPVDTSTLEKKLLALVTPRFGAAAAEAALRAVATVPDAADMATVFRSMA